MMVGTPQPPLIFSTPKDAPLPRPKANTLTWASFDKDAWVNFTLPVPFHLHVPTCHCARWRMALHQLAWILKTCGWMAVLCLWTCNFSAAESNTSHAYMGFRFPITAKVQLSTSWEMLLSTILHRWLSNGKRQHDLFFTTEICLHSLLLSYYVKFGHPSSCERSLSFQLHSWPLPSRFFEAPLGHNYGRFMLSLSLQRQKSLATVTCEGRPRSLPLPRRR